MRTFEVTQHDIDCGRKEDPQLCPIGLCVARTLNLSTNSLLYGVFPDYIRMGHPNSSIQYRKTVPQEVHDFIIEFDGKRPVSPFAFEMDL